MVLVDYKRVLCTLIDDGVLTLEQAKEAVAKCKETSVQGPTWDIAKRLLEEMNKGMVANGRKACRINQSAMQCFEKMVRIDKRDEKHATALIEWCMGHDFWSTVILSPEKFRKHYDTMVAQRERDNKRTPQDPPRPVVQHKDWEKELEERRQVATPMPKGFKEVLRKKAL